MSLLSEFNFINTTNLYVFVLFFSEQVQEMEQMLPNTCQVNFDDPNRLHEFTLIIIPEEGYWVGGRFNFGIYVTEDYNMAVSEDREALYLSQEVISQNTH